MRLDLDYDINVSIAVVKRMLEEFGDAERIGIDEMAHIVECAMEIEPMDGLDDCP